MKENLKPCVYKLWKYLENRIKTKTIKDQKEIKTSEVTKVTRYRDISKQTRDLNM